MGKLRETILAAAAAILTWQLFIPPIVGLADQGDFARMIGRFGYGPADKSEPYYIAFVPRKFVRDPSFRVPGLERPESEDLFVGFAVLLNRLISHDGTLDIEVIGLVHTLAFLAAFWRLLVVTTGLRWAPVLWVGALLILTDVGYAAYWNSFYSEPSSCTFFLLVLAETIAILRGEGASPWAYARWSLCAVLFVGAKFQNFPLAILLAPLALRLGVRSRIRAVKRVCIAGAVSIVVVALVESISFPKTLAPASAYDVLFLAILPESKTPAADLAWFKLDPHLATYSGTGAWSPGTAFPELVRRGILGRELTPISVARFWLLHPASLWRRVKAVLPVAFSLRPEWCGNFERAAGYYPGARSSAFSLWSGFHERVLARIGKFLIVLLLLAPGVAITAWIIQPRERPQIECLGVLSTCCIMAFLLAICGDAWDNVKHLFLFNLLLDTTAACAITFLLSITYNLVFTPGRVVGSSSV
jgi:hypothetical protein